MPDDMLYADQFCYGAACANGKHVSTTSFAAHIHQL
jgi:hypothetical protein